MIKGHKVILGGEEYILPPMTLAIMFDNEENINTLQTPQDISVIAYSKIASPILLACLQRNYPEMTEKEFTRLVDLQMMMDMMPAMFNQSGFVPLEAGVKAGTPAPAPSGS